MKTLLDKEILLDLGYEPGRINDLETTVTPEEFYGELTDPRQHDPKKFCYIVHALNPFSDHLLLKCLKSDKYDFSQNIDLLYEPERISEKKLISTSIINQDHTARFGELFFILDVPWSNFISMSPRDMGTNITNPDFVLESTRSPYKTPLEFIKETKWAGYGGDSNYNEVVLTGNKNGNLVKIIGVGIGLTDTGEEIRVPEEAERMVEIAYNIDVPVIELTKTSRIEDCDAEVFHGYRGKTVSGAYINRNGYRYCFIGDYDKNEIKEICKSDKNFYGGNNPVSRKEYLELREPIKEKLSKPFELEFLKKLDRRFRVK